MSKTTDVIVVGSGLAGLAAALAAASNGMRVSVISEGMGCLAIGGGCIDVLGYNNLGQPLTSPFDGFMYLDPNHPYSLVGQEGVKEALDNIVECAKSKGLEFKYALDKDGKPVNFQMPTIAGTLKPTYLVQGDFDPAAAASAQKILVLGVQGFRDFKPKLIINQLRRYNSWQGRDFSSLVLPPPFKENGRSLNALDIAHAVDRPNGRDWMLKQLKDKGKGYDLTLLPPMMGAKAASPIRKAAREALGSPYLELLSVPPGVGALRLRRALMERLHELNVEFFENAKVLGADVKENKCLGIQVNAARRKVTHSAKSYIIASGGILAGGVILESGSARESIFNIPIPVPANVDEWSEPEIFGQHLITRLGVKVDKNLNPINENNSLILENVFFAGRTLGGYDYASEKSGFGVAAATGWKAGLLASRQ